MDEDHEIDWYTPTPGGAPVELRWPDAAGSFLLTCHLAHVDGRCVLVGLDIRSFTETSKGAEPAPLGLAEINHPVLRSLRAGEIADAARIELAALLGEQSRSRKLSPEAREEAKRRLAVLKSPSRPRRSGGREPSAQLRRVADLYNEIVAAGGDQARRPSIYVHQALSAEGVNDSLNTVRGQLHRAKIRGLLNGKPAAE